MRDQAMSGQQEDLAQMGIMLAQLAAETDHSSNGASRKRESWNGTKLQSASITKRPQVEFGNQNFGHASDSFRHSLFYRKDTHQDSHTDNLSVTHNNNIVFGIENASEYRSQQHRSSLSSQQQQKQQEWYKQERFILRELIVLTMRHSNGDRIRFVPSVEEQFKYWKTYGHPVGNRFPPLALITLEGVRIDPKSQVLSEWRSTYDDDADDDDDDAKQGSDDWEFRASLIWPLLGIGSRDAISLCAECGWLYGRVADFVDSVLDDSDGYHCAVTRALATRLDEELGKYHRQLSMLENELPPLQLPFELCNRSRYITLRSLVSRIPPMRDHLRTLAFLADGVGARNLRGGKMLASVLRHSLDGDYRHSNLVRSIGVDCSVPWCKLLTQWMTQGALEDVHSEFFIAEIQPTEMDGEITMSSAYFTWHKQFVLVEGQVPLCSGGVILEIMTLELAREILLIGKGINFIRYCLQDKDWDVHDKIEVLNNDSKVDFEIDSTHHQNSFLFESLDLNENGESRCISALHDAVTKSSNRIHAHILDSIMNRYHLMKHLLALKQFFFLGQGDFVSSFVQSLNQEFRGRTSVAGIYSHTLSAVLEGALRTSNARFLPDYVLGRLGVRLMIDDNDPDRYSMKPQPKCNYDDLIPWEDKDTAQDPWDFICLEYAIDGPLNAIVHTFAMEIYHRVFLFLFRLKRAEWMMNNSWRQSTALNHAILIETKAGGADAPKISAAAEQSSFLLRRISSTRQKMLHFISNIQNYIMFEVLEVGWEGLAHSVDKAQTLDDVIGAHDSYLNEIIIKTLLSQEKDDMNGNDNDKGLEIHLHKLLIIALKFGKFQDHIFRNSLEALNRAAKTRRKVEERCEAGIWGRTTVDMEEGKVFLYLADTKLFHFVENTAKEFDKALTVLFKMLRKEINDGDGRSSESEPDGTIPMLRNHDALQFLLFRLDFCGYYARQSKSKSIL